MNKKDCKLRVIEKTINGVNRIGETPDALIITANRHSLIRWQDGRVIAELSFNHFYESIKVKYTTNGEWKYKILHAGCESSYKWIYNLITSNGLAPPKYDGYELIRDGFYRNLHNKKVEREIEILDKISYINSTKFAA